jgi:hypothetical protein
MSSRPASPSKVDEEEASAEVTSPRVAEAEDAKVEAEPEAEKPEAQEAKPEASKDEPATRRKTIVEVADEDFDVATLIGFGPLQDLIRSLVKQQAAQLQKIDELEVKLEKSRDENVALNAKLSEVLETKATEKALAALAVEVSKDKGATQKLISALQEEVRKDLGAASGRVDELQKEIGDTRR